MSDVEGVAEGRYTAVVDAVEDGLATVFLERDGEEVASAVLEASLLPERARRADAVLSVTVADGELVEADYEPERTEERARRAQSRFDRLSKRAPPDDDP